MKHFGAPEIGYRPDGLLTDLDGTCGVLAKVAGRASYLIYLMPVGTYNS
jgi:hypothetical protein